MPVRNARDPPRSMPYPPSGTRFERPQSPGTYDQNSTDQSYDNMPESPFFGNSANIYDSGTSALVHTPIHEMPQLNFGNSLNVRNANVLRPQQNQAAYLVTKITSRAKLDDERRRVAQDFNLLDDDNRAIVSYISGLSTDQKVDALAERMNEMTLRLDRVHSLINAAWALTAAQQDLLKDLLQHFLIKPCTSYKHLVKNAESYIASHRAKYHLDNYSTEDIIKKTINIYLTSSLNKLKSKYRKRLFKLVNAHVTLDVLARALVDEFHLTPRPTTLKNDILATVALQRLVAAPLAPKKNQKGADTGFWKDLETKMRKLVHDNGTERKDSKWIEWETKIIDEDRVKWSNTGVDVPSDEEEDEADEADLP